MRVAWHSGALACVRSGGRGRAGMQCTCVLCGYMRAPWPDAAVSRGAAAALAAPSRERGHGRGGHLRDRAWEVCPRGMWVGAAD